MWYSGPSDHCGLAWMLYDLLKAMPSSFALAVDIRYQPLLHPRVKVNVLALLVSYCSFLCSFSMAIEGPANAHLQAI